MRQHRHRPPLALILAVAASMLVGVGCGDDDPPVVPAASAQPCHTEPAGKQAGGTAAAKEAAVAYFLSCDPKSCTEDATEHHIEADYGGDLAVCEEVRRNNQLAADDIRVSKPAEVNGDEASLEGEVLITGETFVIELKKVDGSWKVDRIRGSQ